MFPMLHGEKLNSPSLVVGLMMYLEDESHELRESGQQPPESEQPCTHYYNGDQSLAKYI